MSDLQASMQRVYALPDSEQNALAKIIDGFIVKAKPIVSDRPIGKFDGKYGHIIDIDFCNDEIVEMFGAEN